MPSPISGYAGCTPCCSRLALQCWWTACRGRGLPANAGYALSPYLFLIVADLLQQMIKGSPNIRHPLDADGPCTVLQYANNTIMVIHADDDSARVLKRELDNFVAATGLSINFTKSTITPMNISEDHAATLINILGCSRGSFPQTYLGLPLSNTKLRLSVFAPLIARVDKYLSGWKALLLNTAGQVVLVNAVLSSLLT